MEFTVSKADLVRELGLSQGVVEKRTTIPILSNVLIDAEGDQITLTATDLELGIRSSCSAVVKKAGSGTIPLRRLLDYVRLLSEPELHIKFAENQWAHITSGRSRTRIAGMSRDSYPELPQATETPVKISMASLVSMIESTIFAISMEESRFTLNGALLQIKQGTLTMVSTDGHRLAVMERSCESDSSAPIRVLIPRKAMVELLKMGAEAAADANIGFAATENHLFFQVGKRLLLSRKLTGNFPDYDRVLPREQPHYMTLSRDEFRSTIERVSQFSDERTRAVKLKLTKGELIVHSSLLETGESEEAMSTLYDGPDIEIGFNAQYMLDFLRAVPEQQLTFHFKDSTSAGEMRPAGEDLSYHYRYVIMPMRI